MIIKNYNLSRKLLKYKSPKKPPPKSPKPKPKPIHNQGEANKEQGGGKKTK